MGDSTLHTIHAETLDPHTPLRRTGNYSIVGNLPEGMIVDITGDLTVSGDIAKGGWITVSGKLKARHIIDAVVTAGAVVAWNIERGSRVETTAGDLLAEDLGTDVQLVSKDSIAFREAKNQCDINAKGNVIFQRCGDFGCLRGRYIHGESIGKNCRAFSLEGDIYLHRADDHSILHAAKDLHITVRQGRNVTYTVGGVYHAPLKPELTKRKKRAQREETLPELIGYGVYKDPLTQGYIIEQPLNRSTDRTYQQYLLEDLFEAGAVPKEHGIRVDETGMVEQFSIARPSNKVQRDSISKIIQVYVNDKTRS